MSVHGVLIRLTLGGAASQMGRPDPVFLLNQMPPCATPYFYPPNTIFIGTFHSNITLNFGSNQLRKVGKILNFSLRRKLEWAQAVTSIWARLKKWAKASTRAEDRRPLSGFPSTQAGGGGGRRRRRGGGGGQAGGGGGWPQSRPRFKAGLLAPWPLKSLLCLTASVPHLWPLLRSRWCRPHQLALQRMDLPRSIQDT